MKFSAVLAVFSASTALAAPAPADSVSMRAAAPQWTIEKMKRTCNTADTQCDWNFIINPNNGEAATVCTHTIKAAKKASRASGGPSYCGDYIITSGWNGRFDFSSGFSNGFRNGFSNGLTILPVVNKKSRQIVKAIYTDKQLADGNVVEPDQSYDPFTLPEV